MIQVASLKEISLRWREAYTRPNFLHLGFGIIYISDKATGYQDSGDDGGRAAMSGGAVDTDGARGGLDSGDSSPSQQDSLFFLL
jgi:hypothetical protein